MNEPEFPPSLSADEEIKLAKAGGEEARQKIVWHAMNEAVPYVITCSKSFGILARSETISLCWDTLNKCVKNFNPTVGVRFFAYARVWLRGAMRNYCLNNSTVKNEWRGVRTADTYVPRAHTPQWELEEIISCDSCVGDIIRREAFDMMKTLIVKLSKKEKEIIHMRLVKEMSFPEIAAHYKTTRSATQAMFAKSMRKLRRWMYEKKGVQNADDLLGN